MQTKFLLAAAMTASVALAACNSEPETINRFDAQADELSKAPPVAAPPPMITASRTFRCRDNSLFFVDFFNNNTAVLRTERGGMPTATLTAAGPDGPFTGGDHSVSANADNVTISAPGKGSQSCHT